MNNSCPKCGDTVDSHGPFAGLCQTCDAKEGAERERDLDEAEQMRERADELDGGYGQ